MTTIPGPIFRAHLLAAGFTDDEVRRRCKEQGLVPLRRGAYVDPASEEMRKPETRHALAIRAAVEQLGRPSVISHVSAAVLHGIALWNVPFDRVHVTRPGSSGGRLSRHLQIHVSPLDDSEITEVDGVAVTDVVRTVADLLRSLPFEQAVVVADDVLHRDRATVGQLEAALAVAGRRQGIAAALRALAFADRRAESPGESLSRVRVSRAGIPTPELQVPVFDGDGRSLGRSDFGWEARGVVGEFDGRVKYGRLLRPGQDPGDAVFEEKVREDAIRDSGMRVVRWTWGELEPFDAVARRLRRALDAGGRLPAR